MGIKKLSSFISEYASTGRRETTIGAYFGRKIAIDASMCIYQFLTAIRTDGAQLTNDKGQVTSHLAGLFYRTLRLLENGIKPVYVFDGEAPLNKSIELEKRLEARRVAEEKLKQAIETGDVQNIDKYSRRTVKIDGEQIAECKKLLTLMGVPFFEAPSEAEAQCVKMVQQDIVYAVASEDMDCLTFGGRYLLRNFLSSASKKLPIIEFDLNKIIEKVEMTQEQFVDFCILLGCDYAPKIKGIGPQNAFKLIKKYSTIEEILKNETKYESEDEKTPVDYVYIRNLFLNPLVSDCKDLKLEWNKPNVEGLYEFLVTDKSFNENIISNSIKKLTNLQNVSKQSRLDDFFKRSGTVSSSKPATTPVKKKAGKKQTNKK